MGSVRCVICQTDHAANEPCALVRPGGQQATGTQVVTPGVSPLAAAVGLFSPKAATPAAAGPQVMATPQAAVAATAPPVADVDALLGGTIGSFKVVRKLGVGGMGTVYLGEQVFIGSKVAIKVLHPHLATNVSLVQRFYAEARAANVIGHEHIVNIIDLNLLPPTSTTSSWSTWTASRWPTCRGPCRRPCWCTYSGKCVTRCRRPMRTGWCTAT
jgi:hypothetical protein